MNARVNYLVKRILNALVNDENIDIDDEALQEYAKLEVNKLLMHGTTIQFQVNQTLYIVLTSPFFLVNILKLLFLLFSYYTAFLNINDAFNIVHTYDLCTMYFIFLCMYISVMKETSPCT